MSDYIAYVEKLESIWYIIKSDTVFILKIQTNENYFRTQKGISHRQAEKGSFFLPVAD